MKRTEACTAFEHGYASKKTLIPYHFNFSYLQPLVLMPGSRSFGGKQLPDAADDGGKAVPAVCTEACSRAASTPVVGERGSQTVHDLFLLEVKKLLTFSDRI